MTRKGSGIFLLMTGLMLFGIGISYLDSLASRVAEAVKGAPADKALWVLVSGVIIIMAGTILISKEEEEG